MIIETYTTRQDYIDYVVVPSLGEHAGEHDVEAIADDALVYVASKQVFVQWVEASEYWGIVERHAIS